ncbi:TonB-dependent siderophore receptor [Vibrio mimicus]
MPIRRDCYKAKCPKQALATLTKYTVLAVFGSVSSSTFADSLANKADEQTSTSSSTETIVVTGSNLTTELDDDYRATRSTTASKTDTSLRDLPQSVQVVPSSVLQDQQSNSLADAITNVSGVQQTGAAGNRSETFAVRGFSARFYAINGVMLNPAGDRPEAFTDMVDVERIEVLKGPASALYGRGQPGGLVNIITRRPTEEFSGNVAVKAGSFGFRRTEGTVSSKLNEDGTLRARVSGAAQTEEGFREHRSRSNRQYGSVAVDWDLNSDTHFTFDFSQTHQDMPYDRGLIVTSDNQINMSRETYLGEDWSSIDARKTSASVGMEHYVNSNVTVRSYLRYDDAFVHDTGIDYRTLDDDDRTISRRYSDRTADSNNLDVQLGVQYDFTTSSIEHTLLTGLQYGHSVMDFLSYRAKIDSIDIYEPVYGASQTATTINKDFRETIDITSVFVQDQIAFSEQWKMLAGLRYDYAKQKIRQEVGDADPDISDGELTSRAGLVYQPSDVVALYTSYAESFAPQSGETSDHQALDPEKGWQIEAGTKLDLIPDKLSLTTAVFQITKSNVKADDPEDSDYSVTTGEQRVRGIELDVTGVIAPGWKLIGSTALLDAVITKDEDYEVGNKLAAIPRWSGSLWTTYEVQSGDLYGLKFGSGIRAVSARQGDLDNSYSVAGYYSVDAMISWNITADTTLSVNGRNLTDQDYIQTPVSRTENYPGAPRSVLASVNMKF